MALLGIDIGKHAVHALIVTNTGDVLGSSRQRYAVPNRLSGERKEQDPGDWWDALVHAVRGAAAQMEALGHGTDEIVALAVDGTSGCVFLADADGKPLGNAILFDDLRAQQECETLHTMAYDYEEKLGMRFNPTYALPKLLWLKEHRTDAYKASRFVMHPSDYILFRLTGIPGLSNYSAALKTGYDPLDGCFGEYFDRIGIDRCKMPQVVAPGTQVGVLREDAAKALGLSKDVAVVMGATDGFAAQVCSGAVRPGQWASLIGGSFVVKGVTQEPLRDPQGRIYCHKHPQGYFMPSGMSNAGGHCLEEVFGKENLKKFDAGVLRLIPTNILIYPLSGEGEGFPVRSPHAKKFILGYGNEAEIYTAHLEGISFVERLAFETMQSLGCRVGKDIFAVGGSTRGLAWLKIRATVLDKNLSVPKVPYPAMGSAMIAASGTIYADLCDAVDHMLQIERVVTPYYDFVRKYERLYLEFKAKTATLFGVQLPRRV